MSFIGKRAVSKLSLSVGRGAPSRTTRRRLRSERLENRQLLAANLFHNQAIPEDVNEDGQVTPMDALAVINQVGRDRDGNVGRGRGPMTDVNNDGRDSAADALMVINRLNRPERPVADANESGLGNSPRVANQQESGQGENNDGEIQARGDVVLAWNELFDELLVANESKQNPGYASRSMAMLNLAIYDAVTLVEGDAENAFYEYDFEVEHDRRLNANAVASQAASTVLSELYPEQQDLIGTFQQQLTGRRRPSSESIELGTAIGESVIAARANDGFDTVGEYTYSDGAGDFQPDPLNPDVPVWGPAWGEVDTFAISAAEDYRPDTTPALDSEQYAASYNEVMELGAVDSETRTADQTEAGIFWAYDRVGLGTPMALFNDVLRTIAVQEGNTMAENAALFAQASVAMADAGVVAWQTKFGEQFWRPVTAIHQGDSDGNPLTEGDGDWTALGAPDGGDNVVGFTPQFPTFVSGHATFGGALFGAIREFYGTDDIAFELASEELEILLDNPELQEAYGLDLDDAVRSFDSLSEAMAENGRSRVYLGIHFDFDDLVGQEVGQEVASSVSTQFTVPEIDGGPNGNGGNRLSGRDRLRSRGPRGDGPSATPQDAFIAENLIGESNLVDESDMDLLAQDQVDRTDNLRREPNRPRRGRPTLRALDDGMIPINL